MEYIPSNIYVKWNHSRNGKSLIPSLYECVSKSFRTESITKYTLTLGITHWETTQRVMAAKLTRLTHKIAIQLHLVEENSTICSSRSRRPVRKLLDTPSYSQGSNPARGLDIHPRSTADRGLAILQSPTKMSRSIHSFRSYFWIGTGQRA
jgi:hypothetical protein